MKSLPYLLTYLFWFCWAFIVGGLLLVVLLAPIAFFTLPPLTSDPQQMVIISGKLLTLLFSRFIPLCTLAFWIITVLELRHFQYDWQMQTKQRFIFQSLCLLLANSVWCWLAFILIPEMKDAVLNAPETSGLTGSTRAVFRQQHEWGNRLIFFCFVITLCLPYFSLTRFRQKTQVSLKPPSLEGQNHETQSLSSTL